MMNRRQFCERLLAAGAAVAVAPLIDACGRVIATPAAVPSAAAIPTRGPDPTAAATPVPPTPSQPTTPAASPTAAPTTDPTLAAIALVSTTDRVAGVRRAIELLGINPVRGRNVLLKPNLNSADPAPGSTHPDVLRTLLASLHEMGARSIMLADRSGMGDTAQVMQQTGVFDLARQFGFKTTVLDTLPTDAWEIRSGDGFHWRRGFPVPKMLLDAECVVQTCNLKTHRYGGHFTLSLKNSVGLVGKYHRDVNYMSELHGTRDQRRMIAEINTAYQPALVVMDGIEAFVSGGPDSGRRAATHVILAGTDRVALDAVGVAILRLFGTTPEVSRGRVFEQEQIARAVELGLGVDAPAKIQFLTADATSAGYAAQIRQILQA